KRRIDTPLPRTLSGLIVNCASREILHGQTSAQSSLTHGKLPSRSGNSAGMVLVEMQPARLPLQRNQVLKNLAHMANGQRIIAGVNETRFAIGQSLCDSFRQM